MSTIITIITLLHTARYHFANQLQLSTFHTKNKLIKPPTNNLIKNSKIYTESINQTSEYYNTRICKKNC